MLWHARQPHTSAEPCGVMHNIAQSHPALQQLAMPACCLFLPGDEKHGFKRSLHCLLQAVSQPCVVRLQFQGALCMFILACGWLLSAQQRSKEVHRLQGAALHQIAEAITQRPGAASPGRVAQVEEQVQRPLQSDWDSSTDSLCSVSLQQHFATRTTACFSIVCLSAQQPAKCG